MYPNSAISVGAMITIAVVMVAVLAIWLGAVYYAARDPHQPHQKSARQRASSSAQGIQGTDERSARGITSGNT